MDWLREFLAYENGWAPLTIGILNTIFVSYLLLRLWHRYRTLKQRRAFLYPFAVLGWLVTGYQAFFAAFFHHYIISAILVGCMGFQTFLFLHRVRLEKTGQS
jgi:hypothetical protein